MSNTAKAVVDTELSQGFSHGNFANAYGTTELEDMLSHLEDNSTAYQVAAVLGFLGSYELDEIPSHAREAFDVAYHSVHGQRVIELGYCDSREDDYKAEAQ
jgi:hypothetical protein